MKISTSNDLLYPVLSLCGLLTFLATAPVCAQTWGTALPISEDGYDSPNIAVSNEIVQYTCLPGLISTLGPDLAVLPSTSVTLSFTQNWQVQSTVSISSSLASANLSSSGELPQGVGIGLTVGNGTISGTSVVTGTGFVTVTLVQYNNSGNSGTINFPPNSTGPVVAFSAYDGTGSLVPLTTTPSGGASNYSGISYIIPPPTTTSGTVLLSYSAATETVTASFNGQAIGSYSIAGWNTSMPLPAGIIGLSQGLEVTASTPVTATNFSGGTISSTTYASWVAQYGLTGNNALQTAVLAHDRLTNLFKYALGLVPTTNYNPGNASLPVVKEKSYSGVEYLSLTFTGVATDVTYNVQASSNLSGSWTTIKSYPSGGSAPGTVTVQDTQPITTSPKRYLRLRMTIP